MADNINVTAGTGTTIAADDISGALHQRIKLTWGVDGSAVDASASAPLPVVQTGTPALATGAATAANQTTQLSSLASILAKLSADPSTETTLAAILAKIIAAPATEAKQDALSVLIGQVQASPTTNTLLERLKVIHTDLSGGLAVTGTFWQATQPVSATSLPLPSGASTAANQTTANTSLSSIDGKLPAQGQALAAASVPVVLTAAQITTLTPPSAITGFATETTLAAQSAKLPAALGQTTKAASLSVALASNQDALPITDNSGSLTVDNAGTFAVQATATQSGTWNVTNVSGTVSLPTGAATAANQATGNTSLGNIDTKTPALGQALAAASSPVVLTAIQQTALTPPAAITGFATETTLTAQSAKLPAALAAGGGLKVEGVAGGVAQPVSGTVAVSAVSGVVDITPASPLANDYLPVRLTDGSGFVTAGGGQQYAEDAAHVNADLGTMALTVRSDTAAATAGTTGDYQPLITDASGRLYTNNSPLNTSPTLTSVTANNTDLLAATDVANYRTLTLQITSAGSAGVAVQFSNDGGTTWIQGIGWNENTGLGVTTLTAVGMYVFPVPAGSQMRIRTTSYASGTVTGFASLSSIAQQPYVIGMPLSAGGDGSLGHNFGDLSGNYRPAGAAAHLFNNSTWDRQRGAYALAALTSAARTTTTNSSDQTNYNHRGCILIVNVTSAGTGSITISVQVKDSISAAYYTVWTAAAAITTTAGAIYALYPNSVAAAFTEAASIMLSRTWRVVATANNANSMTYSISADMVL